MSDDLANTDRLKEEKRVELYRDAANAAWAVAERLAKEKLVRERRYLPEFVYGERQP